MEKDKVLTELNRTIDSVQDALNREVRRHTFRAPPRKMFARSNAAGLTEREVALCELTYRDGAEMVLREMCWTISRLENKNNG